MPRLSKKKKVLIYSVPFSPELIGGGRYLKQNPSDGHASEDYARQHSHHEALVIAALAPRKKHFQDHQHAHEKAQ
ncbi:MAG: hypothetical protein HN726_05165 [Candidatus Magasanikbacteria bacterium]|nr:hypothetical protein [Candidatus Magasanikbacteria bacterium]